LKEERGSKVKWLYLIFESLVKKHTISSVRFLEMEHLLIHSYEADNRKKSDTSQRSDTSKPLSLKDFFAILNVTDINARIFHKDVTGN
jgi:hypothetical protein